MSILRKYEIIILLTEEFNEDELKTWVLNYSKKLKKFNVFNTSYISYGKYDLAYSVDNKKKGNYLQLDFSSKPKYIRTFSNILKFDSNVLRFLIFKNKS